MKKGLDKYYDILAPSYDELHGFEQLKKIVAIQELIKIDNDLHLDSEMVLLDIGCGTGISTLMLNILCAGLDPSSELLHIAQRKRLESIETINKNNKELEIKNQEIKNKETKDEKIRNKEIKNEENVDEKIRNEIIHKLYLKESGLNLNSTETRLNKSIFIKDPNIDKYLDCSNHLGYVQGIAESLPFKNKICNISVSVTALHNYKDINMALNELDRITKDRVIITILKQTRVLDHIKNKIAKKFTLITTQENEFDIIFYLKPK